MEGIEKITARIIEDAEREIAQMQRENEEKINALTAEAKSAAGAPVIFGGGGVSQDGIGS